MRAKIPQNDAGIRTEPPPSVPRLSGPAPSATAAALPPLEPPAVRAGSYGLPVTPCRGLSVTPFQPNSGVVVLPTNTAPDSRSRATDGASSSHGPSARTVREPRSVGAPRVRIRSLTVTGTPSTGPAGSPRRQRSSDSLASASASSASIRVKRSSAACAASAALQHRPHRLDGGELAGARIRR